MKIESLRKRKTKALKARYRELSGAASRSSNQAHLFRRIAWRLQVRAEGDLTPPSASRRACTCGVHADFNGRCPVLMRIEIRRNELAFERERSVHGLWGKTSERNKLPWTMPFGCKSRVSGS
ncbi:MAG: DUF2924 domain-containing protein [Acidobacteriaceae bacterium]|nr:DUF2924 domain-containing protein [Acidobacteriaceae bacterium]MBV9502795.1 DUF2924 domain-containing protein [Acidobacteriaceae bacterium]